MMNRIWGPNARISYLIIAAAVMLLMMLGVRELWTQEWRWADISWNMIYSKDYLHPYLAGAAYYDKPLLSYWLMILCSHLVGSLNEWALRMPPALAGILSVWCTYRIGWKLVDRRVGLIAGWMLVTTYFFIFWGRTANADMLNLAGIMLALFWYFEHQEQPSFINYTIFFLILAVTGLFKGLIGIIIPIVAILPNLIQQKNWQRHLKLSLIPALIPAMGVYLLPFWASAHFGGEHYSESGLYEVYRENILRYISPFDHKGPIYTYFVYLPIYMLPWALFFIPAIFSLRKRWSQMVTGSRWMVWSTLLIFLFLTLSGSRRNYYVLPLVPFATLMTADWIAVGLATQTKRVLWAKYTLIGAFIAIFVSFGIVQPLYYCGGGLRSFAREVQQQANALKPWSSWNIVFLDALSKLTLYMSPARPIEIVGPPNERVRDEKDRTSYSAEQLLNTWPAITKLPPNTIFVTRVIYMPKLAPYLKNYKVVLEPLSLGARVLHTADPDREVAYIPLS